MATLFETDLDAVLSNVRDILIAKNFAYGNSALQPCRIFSKADRVEQLKVRIDDKLSRMIAGNGDMDEDTVSDLIGYLVLLKIAQYRNDQLACIKSTAPLKRKCGRPRRK